MKWGSVTLDSLTDADTPITYGVVKPGEEGDVPFIRGGDIAGGRILIGQLRTISREVSVQYRRTLLRGGEILISLVGNPGQVAIAPPELVGANIARQVGLVRLKPNVDPRFVSYFLQSPQGQAAFGAQSLGSVQQVINLRDLKTVKVPLPPLAEQKRIASILGSLDDKIELNREMNETLEQMAHTLFKSWFIDFDPVHAKAAGRQPAGMDKTIADLFPNSFIESETGRIPKGWSMSTIGKELTTILGGTPSRAKPEYWTNGTVAWINSGKANEFRITDPSEWITQEALQNSATKLLPKRTTILAITGATLGQVSVTEIECCANQSVIGIISSNQFPTEYIYPWVKEKIGILIASQTGGAQQHVNKGNVEDLPLLCPDLKVVEAYTAAAKPIFNQIANNCFQTRTLATLRDTLLPKLLSGENPLPVKQ